MTARPVVDFCFSGRHKSLGANYAWDRYFQIIYVTPIAANPPTNQGTQSISIKFDRLFHIAI